jgi:myo-inositol-1(or 4)-monophosphatase
VPKSGPESGPESRPDATPAPPDPIYLATAIEAVLEAGRIQLASFGKDGLQIDKKGAIDLVTEVDVAVERRFRAFIGERFPEHAILAEEMGGPAPGSAARHCWVYDPIDGTTNFAHGLPIFCASLALEIDGVVSVGAIYDPTREELFTAERGGGAYLNGRRLAVTQAESLIDALLCTGFHYDIHGSGEAVLELFGAFVRRARAVRRLGSAALDLCYLAAGRFDGFWEARLKPWDVAAGVLIVEEAGGVVSTYDGGAFTIRGGELVAANGALHPQLLDVISRHRAGQR